MGLIVKGSELGPSGLGVYVFSSNGNPQDPPSVKYTVYNNSGSAVSGLSLPAIPQGGGKFYAPWIANVPNGAYKVKWEIDPGGCNPTTNVQDIFVVDKYTYNCKYNSVFYPLKAAAIPPPGSRTFLSKTILTPNDLFIKFKDSAGKYVDPYSVFWSIVNCKGCLLVRKTQATKKSSGIYWVNYRINGASGDYDVIWEYQATSSAPLQTSRLGFSIICPCKPLPCSCSKC